MPVATTAIALFTATFNLAMAVGHLAISRAPAGAASRRSRSSRAPPRCTAAGTSSSRPRPAPQVYGVALRSQYVWASLHFIAWLPYAYGLETLDLRQLPRLPRFYAYSLLVMTVVFRDHRLAHPGPLHHLTIEWAQVTNTIIVSNTWLGDV